MHRSVCPARFPRRGTATSRELPYYCPAFIVSFLEQRALVLTRGVPKALRSRGREEAQAHAKPSVLALCSGPFDLGRGRTGPIRRVARSPDPRGAARAGGQAKPLRARAAQRRWEAGSLWNVGVDN